MNDDRMFPLVILRIGAVALVAMLALRHRLPPAARPVTLVEPGEVRPRTPARRVADFLDGLWYAPPGMQ